MTVDPLKPANIAARGEAMWADLIKPDSSVERKIVVAEACRLADRLDRYDDILSGFGGEELTPTALAGLNSEARLTAATLQRILIGLGSGSAAAGTGDAQPDETKPPPSRSIADEIAARRTARQANSAS